MKIIVIGGTGLIGSKVVTKLRDAGREAVAASPRLGVNTITGQGLAKVLTGASVVVDLTNTPSFDGDAALAFFEKSTRNLIAAESAAGVQHHVALSVVGAARLAAYGYIRAKFAQEELVKGGSIPYSIIEATQFFETVQRIADEAIDGGTVRVPPVLVQPIAADDVAGELCKVSAGPPINGTIEIAGPEVFHLDELVRRRLIARHGSRKVVADAQALFLGAEVDDRSLLPGAGAHLAETRFDDWLARSVERGYARLRPPAPSTGDGPSAAMLE
ncbi:MAG: SDR family oxidoreductase [Gemmatimonadaceae bacterium]